MKRILVIDDDDSVRLTLKVLLRKEGFEILEADNGKTGLELATNHLPDIIISDVNMGSMDGFEMLEKLRSQALTAGIQVVIMTGIAERADMSYSRERGADDFLAKPFAADALLDAVHACLKRQTTL